MGYSLPRDGTLCILDDIKACLTEFHTCEIYLDCWRGGCWKTPTEINPERAAVNLTIPASTMDASAQRPINGCDFNNEAQIAQVTIEIFSLLCNEDNYTSEELVIAVHALLRQRICECWGDPDTEIMNWDRLEFLGWQIQSRKDTVDSNVNYSVLTSTLSAYYRSDFCKPGSIKRCN